LALFLLAGRGLPKVTVGDAIFAAMLVGIIASFATNPWFADRREFLLLLMSLFAYVAARSISIDQIPTVREAFKWIAGGAVLLGSIVTTKALLEQWSEPHGRPFVFGFDSGATNFAYALGVFVLAVVADELTKRKTQILCASVALPAWVFGASLVRFALAAIVGGLLLNIFLAKDRRQAGYVAALAITLLASSSFGYAVRYQSLAASFGDKEISELKTSQPKRSISGGLSEGKPPPSCASTINENDSISIRKALLRDAMYMAPKAGIFGLGLESFPQYSCIVGYEMHNSFLQVFVELGWLAGGAFIALIGYVAFFTLQLAKRSADVRFILCMVAYETALSLVYGRANRETALFAMIGCSVGIVETVRRPSGLTSRALNPCNY
jgi:hypothetical protein